MKLLNGLFVLAVVAIASVVYGERVSVKVALEDELHRPIAGEKVKVMFWNAKNSRGPGELWGTTDSKGEFSCVVDTGFVVKFFAGGKGTKYGWVRRECGITDGKCEARLVLTSNENAQEFFTDSFYVDLTNGTERVGFDFLEREIVPLSEDGCRADMCLSMHAITNASGEKVAVKVVFEPTGVGSGAVKLPMLSNVQYRFGDHVPVDGWRSTAEIVVTREKGEWPFYVSPNDECWLLRLRPVQVGAETVYNYVVISSATFGTALGDAGYLNFTYVFYLKKGTESLKTKDRPARRSVAERMLDEQESRGTAL